MLFINKFVTRLIAFLVLLVLLIKSSAFASNPLPSSLDLTFKMSQQTFNRQAAVLLDITITNSSSEPVEFNREGTLFDIVLPAGQIEVSIDGNTVDFSTPHLKRKVDLDVDSINLSAGASFSKSIHLASYFDLSSAGSYTVRLLNSYLAPITFENLDLSDPNTKQTFVYRACDSVQRSQIDESFNFAEIMARTAYMDLNNTPVTSRPSAQRYQRWFGEFSESRYNKVLAAFNKIDNAIGSQQVSYDCGCTAVAPEDRKYVYAYVFSNNHYLINLCDAFWGAPNSGTDSKAGTIVHELSHFLVLGGANSAGNYPEVYGTNAALALAQNNPLHAVNNAENYSYFSENLPAFKMSAKDVRGCKIETLDFSSSVGQPNTPSFASNPLSQAVDNLDYYMLTGGASFSSTTATSTRGGDSARSGTINHNGQSVLATFVTGPGKVQFDWRVSSERGYDGIVFQMTNASSSIVVSDSISGESSWISKSFNIPSGGHTILWGYVKNEIVSSGQDAGWIDNLVISGAASGNFGSSGTNVTEVSCRAGVNLAPIHGLLLFEDEQ